MPTLSTISAGQFCELVKSGAKPCVVDVRGEEEFQSACLPGSICHPVQSIDPDKLSEQILGEGYLPDQPVYLCCGIGKRAAMAGQALASSNIPNNLVVVEGGLNACEALSPGFCSPSGRI